jgi:2-polyprenyl-3-methyl-5-hydroxy-6-metoxy-1,4-benzoquinol methylase
MSFTSKNYFDERIKNMSSISNRSFLAERELKTILPLLGIEDGPNSLGGRRVLDLGCGDKFLSSSIRNRGGEYLGLDVDVCNFERDMLPTSSEYFDLVICLSVIEHISDAGLFMNEIKRVLRSGGKLWMETPDVKACGFRFWDDPTHVRPFTRRSLRHFLKMNGMADIRIMPNFRCKPLTYYRDSDFIFFLANRIIPFSGLSKLPVPAFLKGRSLGLFSLSSMP